MLAIEGDRARMRGPLEQLGAGSPDVVTNTPRVIEPVCEVTRNSHFVAAGVGAELEVLRPISGKPLPWLR